jgi:hypothetical protein
MEMKCSFGVILSSLCGQNIMSISDTLSDEEKLSISWRAGIKIKKCAVYIRKQI